MKCTIIAAACLVLLTTSAWAQTDQKKSSEQEAASQLESKIADEQRRSFAISLVTSLSREAQAYDDFALRTRVLARAADVLWAADNVTSRALFRRAWEAAENGDTADITVKTKDNPPPMVIALRRMGGYDLRSEVLTLVMRRDRVFGEEFFTKLKKEHEREINDSTSKQRANDNWSASQNDAKRLQVAAQLLGDGQIEAALTIAAPALDQVNAKSIGFLSQLRQRNPEVADDRFSSLLSRVQFDPLSDANTISGLSSYAFTPGFYITFQPEGGATWTQSDEPIAPPTLPVTLRNKFFNVAAAILLKPLPQPDRDFSSSGRIGRAMVIRRLLPLFDQFAPDVAMALRAQLVGSTASESPLITRGIKPQEDANDLVENVQYRIDRAKSARDRDQIYAAAAVKLASGGDLRAREFADKIDDSDRRVQVRQFVDFKFVQLAIRKKLPKDAISLIESGQLSHTQRALGYTQLAGLFMDSEPDRSMSLLERSADEAKRIEGNGPDRVLVLIGVATQLLAIEPLQAWDVVSDATKAANLADDFTGENVLRFPVITRNGINTISINQKDVSLSNLFELLARHDLSRAISVARDFKKDAPRAASILAIAKSILDKPSNPSPAKVSRLKMPHAKSQG